MRSGHHTAPWAAHHLCLHPVVQARSRGRTAKLARAHHTYLHSGDFSAKQPTTHRTAVPHPTAPPPSPLHPPIRAQLTSAYKQPVTYNWNVFTSLCRQVYQAEKLAPPTQLSQWASAYSQIFSAASSPAFWQKAMSNGQAAKIAVAVSLLKVLGRSVDAV